MPNSIPDLNITTEGINTQPTVEYLLSRHKLCGETDYSELTALY